MELCFKTYEFSTFLGFFLNFSEFKIDFFELNSVKKVYISICIGADMAGDVARAKKRVITWRRMHAPKGSV